MTWLFTEEHVRRHLARILRGGDPLPLRVFFDGLGMIQTYNALKIRIPIGEFNVAATVIEHHPEHSRKYYTVLDYVQTLNHQMYAWRWSSYYHIMGKPGMKALDLRMDQWKDTQRLLLQKVSNLQRVEWSRRQMILTEWSRRHEDQYPAGYFINLRAVFDWDYDTNYEALGPEYTYSTGELSLL